eukprot:6175481-Pleurochrysis_carterae.AAC.1
MVRAAASQAQRGAGYCEVRRRHGDANPAVGLARELLRLIPLARRQRGKVAASGPPGPRRPFPLSQRGVCALGAANAA